MSRFLELQLGTATPESLTTWLADQYPTLISRANAARDDSEAVYLKVVEQNVNDNEEGEMIAFAQWELPDDGEAPKTSGGIPGTLPPGMNRAFTREAGAGLRQMRNRVLHGKKCFCELMNHCCATPYQLDGLLTKALSLLLLVLNHVFTFPEHQRRGAASLLVTWPFEQADREGIVVYLDSEEGGEGVKLYERLGFKKVDICHVDLTLCGLEGVYTHVAMVREPKKVTAEGETVGELA